MYIFPLIRTRHVLVEVHDSVRTTPIGAVVLPTTNSPLLHAVAAAPKMSEPLKLLLTVPKPIAMLQLPDTSFFNASHPIAMLPLRVVFEDNALHPIAILYRPVSLSRKELYPIAVL